MIQGRQSQSPVTCWSPSKDATTSNYMEGQCTQNSQAFYILVRTSLPFPPSTLPPPRHQRHGTEQVHTDYPLSKHSWGGREERPLMREERATTLGPSPTTPYWLFPPSRGWTLPGISSRSKQSHQGSRHRSGG